MSKLPAHAKAYGKRIKDHYGIPFGHLQQCAAAAVDDDGAVDGDEALDGDEDGEEPKKALEACPDDLEFPEDENGAKAFWVFTEEGLLILGV